MAFTNVFCNTLLSSFFTNSSMYLGLHITDPTNAGLATTELSTVSAPNYTRQPVVWTSPSNRSVSNVGIIAWNGLPIISCGYVAAWDSPTGGSMLAVFPAPTPLAVTTSGGSIYIPANAIVVTVGGSPDGRVQPVPNDPFAVYTEDPLNPGVLSVAN